MKPKYTNNRYPVYTVKHSSKFADADMDDTFRYFDTSHASFYEGYLYACLLGHYAIEVKFTDAVALTHMYADTDEIVMHVPTEHDSCLEFHIDAANLSVLHNLDDGTEYGIPQECMKVYSKEKGKVRLWDASEFMTSRAGAEYTRLLRTLLSSKYIYTHDFGKPKIERQSSGKKSKKQTILKYRVTGEEQYLPPYRLQAENNVSISYANLIKIMKETPLCENDIDTLPMEFITLKINNSKKKDDGFVVRFKYFDGEYPEHMHDSYLFDIQHADGSSIMQLFISADEFYNFCGDETRFLEVFKALGNTQYIADDDTAMYNQKAIEILYSDDEESKEGLKTLVALVSAPLAVLNYIRAIPPKPKADSSSEIEEVVEDSQSSSSTRPKKIYLKTEYKISSVNMKNYRRAQKQFINYSVTDWSVRGHWRHYKDGKVVWIKSCERHRKCLEGNERNIQSKQYEIEVRE